MVAEVSALTREVSMRLNLFYLSGNTTGGWVTYTAHLGYGLSELDGVEWQLYKIGNRTEKNKRPFGYDVEYRNVDLETAVKETKQAATIVVALQKNFREQAAELIKSGAWLVVHDPAEFANLKLAETGRYLTIRRQVQKQVKGSVFLPHPYKRHFANGTLATGEWRACSISRIDFDKHTDILLDANRLLPKELQIRIHGFENRLYTKFKICPKYPEWVQSVSHYARERVTATELCHRANYTCDMSVIQGDGGGTQYTFLEAMDAGSVNVIHKQWLLPEDEMVAYPQEGANCLAVESGEELATLLQNSKLLKECKKLVLRGNFTLTRHKPVTIARQLVKTVGGKRAKTHSVHG